MYRDKYQKLNNLQILIHAYLAIMHVHIQTFPHNQTPQFLTLLIPSSLGPYLTHSILNFEDCSAPVTNIPLIDVKSDWVLILGTSMEHFLF